MISLGSFFSGLAGPAAWASMMDFSGKHTATVFGITNMGGVLGAVVCPVVLGFLFSP
jgi:MFS family permease